jgi:hypothetical protein
VLLALFLGGCASSPREVPQVNTETSGGDNNVPDSTPFPSPVPGVAPSPAVSAPPLPRVSAISGTTSVATEPTSDWTRYVSINGIRNLAVADDGSVWANTYGGLIHWNLGDETYVRYPIEANDIALAPEGGLWLAIDRGLCHFTPAAQPDGGATCQNYGTADGLIHDHVRALAVSAEGVVWAGAETGVSRFDGTSWRNYPATTPTEDLAVAPNGEVWQATATGIGRYSPGEDSWTTYTVADGLPHNHATVIATGPQGQVWAYLQWYGIAGFDGERWRQVEDAPGGMVGDIVFSSDGTPWVGTVGGSHYPGGSLAYHQDGAWIDVSSGEDFTSFGAVSDGPEGMVAAATSLGLAVYGEGQWRLYKDGPIWDTAASSAITPDGSIWFAFGDRSPATPGGGISRFDGGQWTYFLGDAEVNALTVAPDGGLWAGSEEGLMRFDGHAWEVVAACETFTTCAILDIAFDADGGVWVASGFDVGRLHDGSWTSYDRLVHGLRAGSDGSMWMNGWEGTVGSNIVARFKPAEDGWEVFKSVKAYPGGFSVGAVSADGCVWGTVPDGRLACFDGEAWAEARSWTFFAPPEGISLGEIATIEPDGALWLHTESGLARFDPAEAAHDPGQAWITFSVDQDQVPIAGPLAVGSDGQLWMGTARFLRPKTLSQEP